VFEEPLLTLQFQDGVQSAHAHQHRRHPQPVERLAGLNAEQHVPQPQPRVQTHAGSASYSSRTQPMKPVPVAPIAGSRPAQTRVQTNTPIIQRVIGIGVGSTGLSALKRLFIALDVEKDAGLTFVVVQHTTAEQAPHLAQLIASFTELQVVTLLPGQRRVLLAPDRVYVAPKDVAAELISVDGRWVLDVGLRDSTIQLTVVDQLFRSLAHSVGSKAVGVVLPGAGADGALGVQAIARAGGITFATEPSGVDTRDASDTMPRNAIATGCVKQVLSPFDIAQSLSDPTGFERPAQPRVLHTPAPAPPSSRPSEQAQFAGQDEPAAPDPQTWLDMDVQPERDAQHASLRSSQTLPTYEALSQANTALRDQNRKLLGVHCRLQRTLAESIDIAKEREERCARTQASVASWLSEPSMALILLDTRGRVQGFGGALSELFDLSDEDIGQPFDRIFDHAYDMPPLPNLHTLHADAPSAVVEVSTPERCYVRRVVPFGAGSFAVMFLDITGLKALG